MVTKQIVHRYFDNPLIFNFVRHLLDSDNTQKLRKVLKKMQVKNILDIGCGTGGYIKITDGLYAGIDNNESFIRYCKNKFENEKRKFYLMDATKMNFEDSMFDASVIINTIHHLTDEEVVAVLKDMARVSQKAVIIVDAVPPRYNLISKILYSLDRGNFFRPLKKQVELAEKTERLIVLKTETYRSKPGFYKHSLIICKPREDKLISMGS